MGQTLDARNPDASGIRRPTYVQRGTDNPLYFLGLPVRWANADIQQWPIFSEKAGSRLNVGPSPSQAQGSLFGLRFASALNTRLLKLMKPRSGVTIAVPRPTADQIPDQRSAFLSRTRGMTTPFPSARPQRWDSIGEEG